MSELTCEIRDEATLWSTCDKAAARRCNECTDLCCAAHVGEDQDVDFCRECWRETQPDAPWPGPLTAEQRIVFATSSSEARSMVHGMDGFHDCSWIELKVHRYPAADQYASDHCEVAEFGDPQDDRLYWILGWFENHDASPCTVCERYPFDSIPESHTKDGVCAGCRTAAPSGPDEAARKLGNALRDSPEMLTVGVGADAAGPILIIFQRRKKKFPIRIIPAVFCGFRVVVQTIGKVVPA